ncbi:transcription factor btd [Plakobranchus ocellatus]|uniref:Transcription factor btd n=1 Tax=Plakobranchus ocellatus TaxID=259542 RepID=A0AAV3Y7Z3_9GAST|nr:transcription factor btd [Plakobranchus ocellatus]
MGQQFSSVAESVGSGAGGLAYTTPATAGGGILSEAVSGASHPSTQLTAAGCAEVRENSYHHQQQQQQQQHKHWAKAGVPVSLESSRVFPPLSKPPMSKASSSGNPLDVGSGGSRSSVTVGGGGGGVSAGQVGRGEKGKEEVEQVMPQETSSQSSNAPASSEYGGPVSFMPRPEMELCKMSIREAIDSFIEKCLHNSNDGGASDNESLEENTNNQSKVTANNIFALDNAKTSPSSSSPPSHSPMSSKDKGIVSIKEFVKAERESRASKDSGSSSSLSSSPRSVTDRGEPGKVSMGDKMKPERRDSNDEGKDLQSEEVKGSSISDSVVRVESSADENEDTVLVIDCDSEDREDGKPCTKEKDLVMKVERQASPSDNGDNQEGESEALRHPRQMKEEVKRESPNADKESVKDEKLDLSEVCSSPDQKPGAIGGKGSPDQQQKGNLLMRELSKKPVGQSFPSPSSDSKAVRPPPFFPGPIRLQVLIDKVLDSSLNEGSETPEPSKVKKMKEELIDVDKQSPSSKGPIAMKEESKNDETAPKDAIESKARKDKSEKEKLKEQISQSKNVQMCFKDHIEKVLLESFLSYEEEEEEEERKEAGKKASSPLTVLSHDSKGPDPKSGNLTHLKAPSSPKNAISVQDIVDQVITQTEAINKNMSTPSSSDSKGAGQGEGRYSTSGATDINPGPASSSASRPHHSISSSSTGPELNHSNSSYHHHHYQHQPQQQLQQQQQYIASQPMSSQDKALQEAQRHVVLKEHQSSTTTGRKRGRPRRVSPSASTANSLSTSNSHPLHSSAMSDFRMSSLAAAQHYPEDRSRQSHIQGHGPPPLDYNPHGSLSFGLPPGVSALLPPHGAASVVRQHQIDQQRQQQHIKELSHGHALHGPPPSSSGYPASSRNHHPGHPLQRDAVPHHLDLHHARPHIPHQQQAPPAGSSSSGGSSSIKPPPPLILADNTSPSAAVGTRLVPVSHIPTKSCSCHSCVAHFSGSSSTPSASEKGGSPATSAAAAQHARLMQQQHQQHAQNLRPGSSSSRHEGRETSRSPHHQYHASHNHSSYGSGSGPYQVSTPPSSASSSSSSASSRHSLPSSAKDYYGQHHQQHVMPRGGECLRPVVPLSSRGFPPQAIIPSYVAAQQQQQLQQRDIPGRTQDMASSSATSPHQPFAYPRESPHHRYYDPKTSSSGPSSNSYQQYPPGSQHSPHPHHSHPHQQQQYHHQQQQHSSPSSQHSKPVAVDQRYPDHEGSRHPDYITASAGDTSHYRYESRSHREGNSARPVPPPHSSSPRAHPLLPPPGSVPQSSRHQAPVEADVDAPLDLSVKPSKKDPGQQQDSSSEAAHRMAAPSSTEADLHHRAHYRRRSQELLEGHGGQHKYAGEYRDSQPSQSSHYPPNLEHNSSRYPPQHRSNYPGPHHSHHPPHQLPQVRASASPHHPRSETHQQSIPLPHYDQQERIPGYSVTSRARQSPVQQRGYPPQANPPVSNNGSGSGGSAPRGGFSRYPMAPTSPSTSQQYRHSHQPQPLPPPQHTHQNYHSQPQHQRSSSSNSGSSANNHAPGSSVPPQNYYSRSPVLGRPRAVSPGNAGTPHYQKLSDSSPHQPYTHGAFPPPPQSSSPYQRPPSHNQEGDNPRPSPVSWGRSSAGPPPLSRGSSDTPSPDEDEVDPQGKLNISKHEPIQNIIGNHSQGDILYLICRLCRQTYGNPYGFRKHFRKEHGFEPKAEHTVVQTISATKSAMAHPASLDHIDSSRGISSGSGPDSKSVQHQQQPYSHSDNSSHHPPYPQHMLDKQDNQANIGSKPRSYSGSERTEGAPPKRSEVMEDLKLLECPECSQTFQLNDFGSYKRHCRQHNGGPGVGPFLCHDCQRCFAEPEQLQEHLNTHADFTPSVCGICLTPFSAPDYLAEHLKAAHGLTSGSSSGQSHSSTPGWGKGEDRKSGNLVSAETGPSHNSWAAAAQHSPHQSSVKGASLKPAVSAPISSSSPSQTPSKHPLQEHSDPQHAIVHTPRGLQVEKLPADPAVMTASPDSSYTDEKLHADNQPGSTTSSAPAVTTSAPGPVKSGLNSSGNPADQASLKQQDRELDSNSPSSLKSKDVLSGSPVARHNRDLSTQSQTPTAASQAPSFCKVPSESSRSLGKEDNESVSSDRCASVESNSLSVEGSRTSSPAPDEPEFFYKHKKYSRYNRKRSTEVNSLPGDPATKSARSSSAESSATGLASTTSASTFSTTSSASPSFGAALSGGKGDQNLSPVVTSSANATRDCELSSSSFVVSEDSSSRSPTGTNKRVNNSSSSSSGGGTGRKVAGEGTQGDTQSKKSSSVYSEEDQASKDKGAKTPDSSKKRKLEESEENTSGKRWNHASGGTAESSPGESSKFKWERMTRSQKASQSVSYSTSN